MIVSPLRDRFAIDVEDGDDMKANGNEVDHEYKIERGGNQVAEVSKSLIEVAPVATAIFGKTYARPGRQRRGMAGHNRHAATAAERRAADVAPAARRCRERRRLPGC